MAFEAAHQALEGDHGVTRPRRADAQRNGAAVLEAAKAVFAQAGVNVPARDITDRAGVGVGTLYRHFPRRSDLIVAVLQHEIDALIAAAYDFQEQQTARAALVAWLDRFADFVRTKHGLATALHSGDPAYEGLPRRLLTQLEPSLEALLAPLRALREVRDDVRAGEVLTTVALICQPVADEQADFSRRMVRVFADGLLARND